MVIVTPDQAAALVKSHSTVLSGGFGSCGHAEAISAALGRRFRQTGSPRDLTLLFGSGGGDRAGRGLDHFAQPGMVRRAIGGFWGFAPRLGELAAHEQLDAHNWPLGVISQLFRARAAGLPCVISRAGLGTFVDPLQDGGRLNARAERGLVKRIEIEGKAYLFFPTLPIDCAIIRGTRADGDGNLTFDHETSLSDALAQAQAARNSGGIVIAQVRSIAAARSLQPQQVRVPGALVDYVVVADERDHPQSFGEGFNPAFVSAGSALVRSHPLSAAKRIIVSRALQELERQPKAVVNLGIGIPAELAAAAAAKGLAGHVTTVESGLFGGIPEGGLSFGAASHPEAMIDQAAMFDFYDGGGLDLAFLGFAQVDSSGSVNATHYCSKMTGIGGFANIASTAKRIVFCGTFTAGGLDIVAHDGKLVILSEGHHQKFVAAVRKISFNGPLAQERGQSVIYVTERAVFELKPHYLKLVEVAPGIDVERDIIRNMSATIVLKDEVRRMDPELFRAPASDYAQPHMFRHDHPSSAAVA